MDTAVRTPPAPVEIDVRPVRVAGAGMLAVAALTPPIPIGSVPYRCPLRTLTGIPCPFCGMTRGVIEAVHGHVVDSFLYNPGAMLVVALAIALLIAWRVERVTIPLWTPFVFFGSLWAFQLFKYFTDRPL